MYSPNRILTTSLLFLSIVLLSACGSGGGDGGSTPAPSQEQTPVAVTKTIPTSGGTLSVALAEGAQVVLSFPAGAVAADVAVTVTPGPATADEWLRFEITPGTDILLKPVTLTVTPPANLDTTALPQLRLGSAANPLWLMTKTNADGTLEATLPAIALSTFDAAAQPLSIQRFTNRITAAATPAPAGTIVSGANFLMQCTLSQAVLDDATTVLDNALNSDLILQVLNLLANIKTNCGVNVPTQTLFEQFAVTAGLRYTDAVAAFTGLDYTSSANFTSFAPGMRRALSWCRVAQVLNAQPIDCPNMADFEPSFNQLLVGIANAATATDDLYELRNQYKKVLPLAAEAAAFGAENAEADLRSVSSDLADLLIKRAYDVCNHGDLYDFLEAVKKGAPSGFTPTMLRNDLAYCGTQVVAKVLDKANLAITANERTLLPGSVNDVRPDTSKTTTVPADGSLSMTLTGRATACSRVIGSPLGSDELVIKVGSTELKRIAHVNGDFNGTFDITRQALLTQLAKPADSTDPIDIEVWRENVVVNGCEDDNNDPFTLALDNVKLYTLTLNVTNPASPSVYLTEILTQYRYLLPGSVPPPERADSTLNLKNDGQTSGEASVSKTFTATIVYSPERTDQTTYDLLAKGTETLTAESAMPGQISGLSGGTLHVEASCSANRPVGSDRVPLNDVSNYPFTESRLDLSYLLPAGHYLLQGTYSAKGTETGDFIFGSRPTNEFYLDNKVSVGISSQGVQPTTIAAEFFSFPSSPTVLSSPNFDTGVKNFSAELIGSEPMRGQFNLSAHIDCSIYDYQNQDAANWVVVAASGSNSASASITFTITPLN